MGLDERRGRFEDFVRDYGERAFQFACRLTGSEDEAKDLVQEAFRRALDSWEEYDPSRPLNSWFFTILKHVFLDVLRHQEACPTFSLDEKTAGEDEEQTYADLLPGGDEPMLERLEREEAGRFARRAMARLTVDQRAVLTLSDIEGLDYAGIARALGWPPGTVRSRISRARRDLRRHMLRMGRLSLAPGASYAPGRAREKP